MLIAEKIEAKKRIDTFRYAESLLYSFPYMQKEAARLREEILHPFKPTDDNVGGGKGNLPGDPTGRMGVALATHAKLLHLERCMDAIRMIYDQLPEPKKEFVRVTYWTSPQRYTKVGICEELGISDRTYSRWRRQIVKELIEVLGL